MEFIRTVGKRIAAGVGKIRHLHWGIKTAGIALLTVALIGGRYFLQARAKNTVTYETRKAAKGTLITSVSSSGTITSGNSTSIATKVSGVVKTVYVTNGDTVTKGQKIADVTPDEYATQRETAAWAGYLDAQEAVKTSEKDKADADIQMWKDRQAILDAEDDIEYKDNHSENPDTKEEYTLSEKTVIDKTLVQARAAFAASELKYKDAEARITAAKAKVTSAYREYQENSSTIYASSNGVISDLALAPGIVINATSSTSSSTGATIVSSQTVGKIGSETGQLIASVSVTEVDVVKVKAGQKVTLTLDAYENKTYTGKVLAVNTAGNVSSNVTSYPVSILLDPVKDEIYPNMAVNAAIITSVVTDVITVPSTAITASGNVSTARVLKDKTVKTVTVTTGAQSDSETEIKSGLSEGDEVVTSEISASAATDASSSTSPFSGLKAGSSKNSSSSKSSGSNMGGMGEPPMGGF